MQTPRSDADFCAVQEELSTREGGHCTGARRLRGQLGTSPPLQSQGHQHFKGDQLPRGEKKTSWAGKPRERAKQKATLSATAIADLC